MIKDIVDDNVFRLLHHHVLELNIRETLQCYTKEFYPHAMNTLKNQGANNKVKKNEGKLCTSLLALD